MVVFSQSTQILFPNQFSIGIIRVPVQAKEGRGIFRTAGDFYGIP